MNGPLMLEIAKAIGALAGLVAVALTAYWRVREKRREAELGLEGNPQRCGIHQEAIDGLKGQMKELKAENSREHTELFNQVGAVGKEVARICGRMNGSGT